MTDEGRLPLAKFVHGGLADIVQERGEPGDQIRGSERGGQQRVAEDIVAVPAALLHALAGL